MKRKDKGRERCKAQGARRSMFHVQRLECGFTLVEVSIVIFIMLIMTAITVPWMKTFAESTKLKSSSRSIISLIEFARSSAVTQRMEYVVLFDPTNGEYWLSLKEFLDTSGSVVVDSSRTNLTESLEALEERQAESKSTSESTSDNSNKDDDEVTTFSRTGGILGIPKKLPESITIARIISPQDLEGSSSGNVDYVTFYPDGTAEDFEIYLQSNTGRTFLLSIAASTGRTGIRQLKQEELEELGLMVEE